MGYGLPSTLGAHLVSHRQWTFHCEVPAPAELKQLSSAFLLVASNPSVNCMCDLPWRLSFLIHELGSK